MALQRIEELEQWHAAEDPWDYEQTPDDRNRKAILLNELPSRAYANTLDIGCGQGFVTRDLPGGTVIGIDISHQAIARAQKLQTDRMKFRQASLFDLSGWNAQFDLIVVTGVLYPQYIGNSLNLVYLILDRLLADGGILVSVHIDDWYKARFPYLMLKEHFYAYRDHTHRFEVYAK